MTLITSVKKKLMSAMRKCNRRAYDWEAREDNLRASLCKMRFEGKVESHPAKVIGDRVRTELQVEGLAGKGAYGGEGFGAFTGLRAK